MRRWERAGGVPAGCPLVSTASGGGAPQKSAFA